MLCAVQAFNEEQSFPSLGLFLTYVNPKFPGHSFVPPVVQAANTIRRGIPEVAGTFLTKEHGSDVYTTRSGFLTFSGGRHVFHCLESDILLHLDFTRPDVAAGNLMLLEKGSLLEAYPRLGLFLKHQEGNISFRFDRLDIGLFPSRVSGEMFLNEWVSGLCYLYAQATSAIVDWIGTRNAPAEPRMPLVPCEDDQVSDKPVEGFFYAWFPEAKPKKLHNWLEPVSKKDFDMSAIREWNQYGPFAAGFYLVHISGTPEKPKISFCDVPETVWELECDKWTSAGLLKDKKKVLAPCGTRKLRYDWSVYMAESGKCTPISGWFYLFPEEENFDLFPLRVEKRKVGEWKERCRNGSQKKNSRSFDRFLLELQKDADELAKSVFGVQAIVRKLKGRCIR